MHHLWRPIFLVIVILTILAGSAIYGARLPNQDVCALLYRFNQGQRFTAELIDLNTSHRQIDPRAKEVVWSWNSPDGQHYLQARRTSLKDDHISYSVVEGDITLDTTLVARKPLDPSSIALMARWSPDSQKVAILWQDDAQAFFVSIVGVPGGHSQTVPFLSSNTPSALVTDPRLHAWSADGRYLTIGEVGLTRTYTFWDTEPLHRLASPVEASGLMAGAWSPDHHTFAAVIPATQTKSPQLVILSPDGETTKADLERVDEIRALLWSPRGQSLVVAGLRHPCAKDTNCLPVWIFQLYSRTGKPIGGPRTGTAYNGSSDGRISLAGNVQADAHPLPGVWKDETWAYVTQRQDTLDLMAVNSRRGDETLLAHNLLSEYVDSMFFYSVYTNQSTDFGLVQTVPANPQLIVPTEQNGRIKVELMDADGSHRQTLVERADYLIDARAQRQYSSAFWLDDGRYAITAWAEGAKPQQQAHLVVVSADGTQHYQIDGMNYISELEPIYSYFRMDGMRGVGYLAQRDEGISLDFLNFQSGLSAPVLEHLQPDFHWDGYTDPQHQHLVINNRVRVNGLGFTLYVVPITGSHDPLVYDNVWNYTLWSSDGGRMLLERSLDEVKKPVIEVRSTGGDLLKMLSAPLASWSDGYIASWTNCE